MEKMRKVYVNLWKYLGFVLFVSGIWRGLAYFAFDAGLVSKAFFDGVNAILGLLLVLSLFLIIFLYFFAWWILFEKANISGWKSLIPVYNVIMMFRLVGWSAWEVLLFLVPLVNLVVYVVFMYRFFRGFGRGGVFSFLGACIPFVFAPIVAADTSVYQLKDFSGNLSCKSKEAYEREIERLNAEIKKLS